MIVYSVVIPTNRSSDHIIPLLESLACQTLLPYEVIIIRDKEISTHREYDHYFQSVQSIFHSSGVIVRIIHPSTDPNFFVGQGASYVRNYGRQQVTSPYMMFIDDDNTFSEDMLATIFNYYTNDAADTVIVPIQYDDDGVDVRACLADGFNFYLCRPHRLTTSLLDTTDRYVSITLASSNCLIGPTSVFEHFPFYDDVPFVYEDLIITGEMQQHGVRILCDTWSSVIHHHGKRSRLAELYIDTPRRAYYKAKHRIILVHTIGSWKEKIQFYCCGLVGQLGWLLLHILWYAPVRQWPKLIGALIKGTYDGIFR